MTLSPEIEAIFNNAMGGAPVQPSSGMPGVPGSTPGNAPNLPAGTPSMGAVGIVAPTNPVGTQSAAQTEVYNAQQRDITATSGYYDAQAGLIPYSRAELDAQSNALGARSAYLNEQMRALQAEQGEAAAIASAKANTGDLLNTARAQRERDSVAYRYNLAGLPTPVEITLPQGHTGPLPAGVVARLQTLAEILTDKASDAAAMRKFNVEAARIHAETTQTAVTAAQIASGRVRLSIDEVELAMRRAGLDVNQATLNLDRTQQGPPGMVLDEEGNEWVTPADLRVRQLERSKAAQDAVTGDEGVSDLSPLSLDGIISWAVAGGLGPNWESTVRSELERRAPQEGYTPGFIEYVIATIKAREPEAEGGSGDFGPAIGGVGGDTSPAPPRDPNALLPVDYQPANIGNYPYAQPFTP